MEIRTFVLYCTIFSSVAAFSLFDDFEGFEGNDTAVDLLSNPCKCTNGRCVTDNRGKTKCNCKSGYSLQDEETCAPCDCGKKGKCIFILYPQSTGGPNYVKKCLCDIGSAEKDGVCVDCQCGENSKCEFEDGEKVCYCIEGYAEKDGVCTRCDCGEDGECTFKDGQKVCTCYEGYLEHDGKCLECDCGEHGTCTLDGNGQKVCSCNDGHRPNDGTCETCDCGSLGVDCNFENGKKVCKCQPNAAQSGELCADCACGANSNGCDFSGEKKRCLCNENYIQKGDMCKESCESKPCVNGGQCNGGSCTCLNGTSGEFCEIIDQCDQVCPKSNGVQCFFDVKKKVPYCECTPIGWGFNPKTQDCRRTCNDNCTNGGKCQLRGYSKFCCCLDGTEGDYCEVVPGCKNKFCGVEADCQYDLRRKAAACICREPGLDFDPVDNQCKKTCKDNSDCKNGATCTGDEFSKFCRCLPGTEGNFCEKVPGCGFMDCGKDAKCVFDLRSRKAGCQCLDKDLAYDTLYKSCKKTCDVITKSCKNGGNCVVREFDKFCECPPGTSGDNCEIVDECVKNRDMCKDNSRCVFDIQRKKAICECPKPGEKYDPLTNKCKNTCEDVRPCRNGGNCVSRDLNNFCECPPGTSGEYCEIVDECVKNRDKCKDNSKCIYDIQRKKATCECPDKNMKYDPTTNTCKRDCSDVNPCENGGSCGVRGDHRFCNCPPGTSGDDCKVVDDCVRGLCKGDSVCGYDTEQQKAVCRCRDQGKQYDSVNARCELTCDQDSACKNGGLCMHRGGHLFCHCKPGTSGPYCEVIDECGSKCGNGRLVVCGYDTKKETATCSCSDDRYLFDAKICKICDCGGKEISCGFKNGQKECVCPDGYAVINGYCKKQRCVDRRCLNGQCNVVNDQEVCNCFEGFYLDGDACVKKNCMKTPCNNGTCVVRNNGFEQCICPSGYTLRSGSCIRGKCRIDTCFGGQCKIIDGELTCVCPKGYGLEGIGCFATVCKVQHCFGGNCVVDDAGKEICTCPKGYKLVNDVCKLILCEKKNCFGGTCQLKNGMEECVCPGGYTLFQDVCRENILNLKE